MLIRLKKPTFLLNGDVARELPHEALFNLSRVGAVTFGTTVRQVRFQQNERSVTREAGKVRTIAVHVDGDLNALLDPWGGERRFVLAFPDELHGEYERLKRILEARVVES